MGQPFSMARPRRPLTCWARFCRVSHMLVRQGHQVNVDRPDCGAGKPNPQCFAEGLRGEAIATTCTDRRPARGIEEQIPNPVVADAKDLAPVSRSNEGCHPDFEPCPHLRCRSWK